jgi:hypothetical protein
MSKNEKLKKLLKKKAEVEKLATDSSKHALDPRKGGSFDLFS